MDETFVKERIGQLVADSGKSEKRISRDLGRSVGYIQSLTSGKALPSMPMLFQICEYFNIEPAEFFDVSIKAPNCLNETMGNLKGLNSEQLEHINAIVRDMKK